ncbi:MAG: hypothetical protein AAF845_17035 [Bacteroidota bacterium]
MIWRDLDVPDVIALGHRFVDETPRRRAIASSAFETAWMDALAEAVAGGPVVFVSEASTLYFPEAANRQLYADLAARFPGAHVVFDTAAASFVGTQDTHDALRHCGARVTWTVDDPTALEAWGLRVEERFPLMRPPRWIRGEAPLLYRLLVPLLRLARPAMADSYHLNVAQLPG